MKSITPEQQQNEIVKYKRKLNMNIIASECWPNEIRVNYIQIPKNQIFGYDGLEYFEKLDLIWLRFNCQTLAFQLQNNQLTKNTYTKMFQQQITHDIFNYKNYCFLENTEQVFQYKNQHLYFLQLEQNRIYYTEIETHNNKLIKFDKIQAYDKFFLSNSLFEIHLNRRSNLKHVLRYKPKQMKVGGYQYEQFIFMSNYSNKLYLLWKQSKSIKIIRRINTLKYQTKFSLNRRYLLICYEQNKPYFFIDLSSMKTIQTFDLLHNQQYKSSFFIKQLGLFIIHINNKDQQQIEDQTILKQNMQVQTLQTQKEIKFIKFHQIQGLKVFYAE